MRVFVTGAGGFVGRRLVDRLRRPDAGPAGGPLAATAACEVEGTDRELDVADRSALESAFERTRPDAIVHLAACSSVAESWRDPGETFRVNFLGTRALLAAAERRCPEARVLIVGSGDQYGPSPPGAPPCDETTPLRPQSPYAWSKAAAERLASIAAERGLVVVRVRAFNHTGPGQSDRFVASSFARQLAEIEAGKREPVLRVGNLASTRDFLDVDDVIGAYLALLDSAVTPAVYNIASGKPVPIRHLLDLLVELADVTPRIEIDPERLRETDQLSGDPTRMRAATGWRPRTPLRETLAQLLDDWRARIRNARPE